MVPQLRKKASRAVAAIAAYPSARLTLTLAIGTLGGFAASAIHMPLAWMLGPFLFCAAGSLLGLPLMSVPHGREAGQVVVGLAIGLRFTAAVLVATLALLPAMVVSTVFVIGVTMIAAFLLVPLARVDASTAFFATAAAGMADMAPLAAQRGGDPNAVSVVHAVRVSTVVLTVPLLVFAFGEHGDIVHTHVDLRDDLPSLVLAIGLAYGGARLLGMTHFPNPWLIGGIVFGAMLAASGMLVISVPRLLMIVSQLAIGVSLGCRFERDLMLKLPRVVFGAFVTTVYLILVTAAGAWVLSTATGLPFSTSFLSIAPAAVTEMALTAQSMNVDAQIVTAFHVMRIALIESSILVAFAIFNRLETWRSGII